MNRKTFGILLDWPDTTSNYQRSILRGIRAYAGEKDINLMAMAVGRLNSPFCWEEERAFLYDYTANKDLFSGFIVFSAAISNFSGLAALEEKLASLSGFPIVSLSVPLSGHPCVSVDNETGFRELVEHVVGFHRYREIAYISGYKNNQEAIIRLNIYKEIMRKYDRPLDDSFIYNGNFIVSSGKEAVKEFYDVRKIRPDAIICANDNMAIGAWQELWERKFSVPQDVALTGFDDLEVSTILDLPFTTVRQPLFQQGFKAGEMLDRLIEGEKVPQEIKLPTEVVYRHSCGCRFNGKSVEIPADHTPELRKYGFISEQKKVMRKALNLVRKGKKGDPLIRAWNSVLLKAIEKSIKQTDIASLLDTLFEEFVGEESDMNFRLIIEQKFDKMKTMFIDFYIQSDLLNRMLTEDKLQNTINAIDDFGQISIAANKLDRQLGRFEEILRFAKINTCYLCIFENSLYNPEGNSKLLFYYDNGVVRKIPENKSRFITKELIPEAFHPKERYELIAEALYEAEERIGVLLMSMGAEGMDTYEILRRRLGSVLHAMDTTQNLITLNRKLQEEIRIREKAEEKLREAMEALQNLSLTDDLTGLYNRRGFVTLGEQQLKFCQREHEPFLLLFIDMDGLKQINDQFGHQEGDLAIKTAAAVIRETMREVDIVARLGGDEFTVFAGKADRHNLDVIKDRISRNLAKANEKMGKAYNVSMSMGVYCNDPADCENTKTLTQILELADRDLYEVKKVKKGLKS